MKAFPLAAISFLFSMGATRYEKYRLSAMLIRGKKAVMVVSQGDFSPSASALLLRVLDSNLKDFQLKKAGEVFSTGNLEKAQVKNKEHDLQLAFNIGQQLGA